MRKTILTLIPLLALTGFALAAPAPYLGLNLQVNSPTSDFAKTNLVNQDAGARTGLGGEADLGMDSRSGSLYLGYSWSRENAHANGLDRAVNQWTLSRAILGGRLNILGNTSMPLVPILGAGATLGDATYRDHVSYDGGLTFVDRDETSKSNLGWFVEGGGLLRSMGPLSLLGSIQYHNFNAKFSPGIDIHSTRVSFVKFQLGARYSFGGTGASSENEYRR